MRIGKKHLEMVGAWLPSATAYGAAAGCTFIYFLDWKLINQYIPFYGGKFKE